MTPSKRLPFALVTLIAVLTLMGCGKKGEIKPPSGADGSTQSTAQAVSKT